MNQNYQALREQLTVLNERKAGLGARLSQAAIELKDAGVPPAELLLQQLSTYREEFGQLRDRVRQLAQSLPKPPIPSQIASLKDIDRILSQLEESNDGAGSRDSALQLLDRVLAIVHTEDPQFPPLQDAHAKAKELRRLIVQSPADALPDPVKTLNSGEHPFVGLLALINPPSDLTDDRWGILVEIVTRAFSKSLTVAAARGKLKINPTVPSVSAVAREAATPNPPAPVAPPAPPTSPEQNFPEVLIISEEETATNTPSSEPSVLKPPTTQVNSPDVIILPSYEQSPNQPPKTASPLVFGSVPLSAQQSASPSGGSPTAAGESLGLKVLVHIERLGDRLFNHDEFAGTRGKALRIEGFAINIQPPIPDLSLEYMAHIEGVGDTPWTSEGEFLGDRGQGKRIEGFAIRLTGAKADTYNVYYVAHIQNIGDSAVCFNGDYCGTRGQGLRIEGVKVWLQKKT